jgi:hypothetical protein
VPPGHRRPAKPIERPRKGFSFMWDREFEFGLLQRGVGCEPDFLGQGKRPSSEVVPVSSIRIGLVHTRSMLRIRRGSDRRWSKS